MVRADRNSPVPFVLSRLAVSVADLRTVPVCDDVVVELEQFVTSISQATVDSVNMTEAYLTGVELFSEGNETGKAGL